MPAFWGSPAGAGEPAIPVSVNVFVTGPPPAVLVVELPVGLVKSVAVLALTTAICDQAPTVVPVTGAR